MINSPESCASLLRLCLVMYSREVQRIIELSAGKNRSCAGTEHCPLQGSATSPAAKPDSMLRSMRGHNPDFQKRGREIGLIFTQYSRISSGVELHGHGGSLPSARRARAGPGSRRGRRPHVLAPRPTAAVATPCRKASARLGSFCIEGPFS